jgi:hypothetical protein
LPHEKAGSTREKPHLSNPYYPANGPRFRLGRSANDAALFS